jgi:ABC-type transport system involved in multi-copper enzyme maturation permease subunit
MKADLLPEPSFSRTARASSVHIGREDYVSILLRLIGMELYKIRHRVMCRVLISICVVATLGLFGVITLVALLMTNNGTPASAIATMSQALLLPASLSLSGQLLMTLGQIVIIILVSTIVGGEYTSGTIRLLLTRGPTRTQLLLAKAGAAVVCIFLGVLGVSILGVITGLLCSLLLGIGPSFLFLSAAWFGHMLLYELCMMLGLTMYAMMALSLSTLGRATAAGLAGVLTWSFLIEPVMQALSSLLRNIGGPWGGFFQALPDYLIGSNISALQQDQERYLIPLPSNVLLAAQSDLHALIVLAVYLFIFLGLAWWVSLRRDVTN